MTQTAVPSVFSWTKTATIPSDRKKRATDREEKRGALTPDIESSNSSKGDGLPLLLTEEDTPVSDFAEVTVAQNDESLGQRVQSVQTDKVELDESSTQTVS